MHASQGSRRTIHVPGEGVPQLLPVNLHVQSDGDQHLGLGRVLVDHGWVVVVEAGREVAACSAMWAGSLCPGPPSLYHWSPRPAQRGPVRYGLSQQTGPAGVHAGQEGRCRLGQWDKLRHSLQEERFKPQSRQDSPSSFGEERVCPEEETLEQMPRDRRVEKPLAEQ